MELLRYSRDVYGQQTLEGVSFELVWIFAGISAAIIVGHLVYKAVTQHKNKIDQS